MEDVRGGWEVPFTGRGWIGTWGVVGRLVVGPGSVAGKLGAFDGPAGFGCGDGAGETTGSSRGGSRLRLWGGTTACNISSVAPMHCSGVRPRDLRQICRRGAPAGIGAGVKGGGLTYLPVPGRRTSYTRGNLP